MRIKVLSFNVLEVQSTQNQYLKVTDEGQTLSLQQKTTFEKGIGFETFLFTLEEGGAVLAGYKISSHQVDN